ncbi:MAG: hypothetical protein IAF02_11840 [Anaerolineae bacterium]|nr:hypothetical protein [Anaerolineae bacterium]
MSNQIPDFESFEPEDENGSTTPDLPPLNGKGETDDELLAEIFGEVASPSLLANADEDLELEDEDYLPAPSTKSRQPTLASQAARTAHQWGERASVVISPRRLSTNRQDTWSAVLTEEVELMAQLAAAAVVAESQTEAVTLAAALPVLAIRLSPQSYRALWPVLPTLVQGVAGLTRFLYGRAQTRPLIRQLPTILENSVADLAERVADGRSVPATLVARVLARQTGLVIQEQQRYALQQRRPPDSTKGHRNGHGYAR